MKQLFTFILIIICLTVFPQNSSTGQKNSDKPKFDPNKKYQSISMDLMSKEERTEFMKKNMAKYCAKDVIYSSAFEILNYNASLTAIDKYYSSDGVMLTIKMSENCLFVFMFNNICDFYEKANGQTNVTFFSYKYGDIDNSSIKTLLVQKKRLYPENNIFTEELLFGSMKFVIENKTTLKKMIFSNKEVELAPYNLNSGFSDRFGK